MRVIEKIQRTCSCYPSKWEGYFSDGAPIIIVYSMGNIRILTSQLPDADAAYNMLMNEQIGPIGSGFLTDSYVERILSGHFVVPEIEGIPSAVS